MTSRPNPDQPFDFDSYQAVWPMGSEKIEMFDGHPLFYGSFDQADVEAAERAFPARRATIEPWDGERGNLLLHTSNCGPNTCPQWPSERT